MTGSAQHGGAGVVVLPVPAQMIGEKTREIGALFPGWKVWHDSWWAPTWNAYREGEQPYFGPGAGGRQFMVSAYSAARLLTLLQEQVRIDIAAEFPAWRVRQSPGGWSAIWYGPPDSGHAAVVQFVHRPTIAGLDWALRARRDGQVTGHET